MSKKKLFCINDHVFGQIQPRRVKQALTVNRNQPPEVCVNFWLVYLCWCTNGVTAASELKPGLKAPSYVFVTMCLRLCSYEPIILLQFFKFGIR